MGTGDGGATPRSIEAIDVGIVCFYLLAILAITGVISWRRYRSAQSKPGSAARPRTASDAAHAFFLAEQSAPWWAVAGSFFASNIGSDAIIGLSSAGATVGIAAGFFDFASALAFIVLAYVFLPVYRSSGVFTLPEFAARRYPGGIRSYLSGVALLLYVVNKTAVALYCGAILIEAVLSVSGLLAVGGLLLLTCVFSVLGGLSAVIYVEVLNTVLLLVGGTAAAALSLHAVGGWQGLKQSLVEGSSAADAAGLTSSFTHLYQPTGMYALYALLIGSPWSILWYHVADQEMVQRGLGAASDGDARLGSLVAGFLKLAVPWTWAVPGIVARLLYPAYLGCPTTPDDGTSPAPPSGSSHGVPGAPCARANLAYPAIMLHLLPPGLLGLVLAASLAGVLSVLASTFNSASTIVATDIYRRMVPGASPSSLVWAGRAWILVMTGLAVAWLPLLSRLSPSLYVSMQLLNAALAPPIVVIFAAAVTWPRANTAGALSCLALGHGAGITRMVVASLWPEDSPGMVAAPWVVRFLAGGNFLVFSGAVGLLSVVTLVVASLVTPPPDEAAVELCTLPCIRALYHRWHTRRSPGSDQGGPAPVSLARHAAAADQQGPKPSHVSASSTGLARVSRAPSLSTRIHAPRGAPAPLRAHPSPLGGGLHAGPQHPQQHPQHPQQQPGGWSPSASRPLLGSPLNRYGGRAHVHRPRGLLLPAARAPRPGAGSPGPAFAATPLSPAASVPLQPMYLDAPPPSSEHGPQLQQAHTTMATPVAYPHGSTTPAAGVQQSQPLPLPLRQHQRHHHWCPALWLRSLIGALNMPGRYARVDEQTARCSQARCGADDDPGPMASLHGGGHGAVSRGCGASRASTPVADGPHGQQTEASADGCSAVNDGSTLADADPEQVAPSEADFELDSLAGAERAAPNCSAASGSHRWASGHCFPRFHRVPRFKSDRWAAHALAVALAGAAVAAMALVW